MNRRSFLGMTAAGVAAGPLGAHLQEPDGAARSGERKRARFGLKYAPHFGMFREHAGGDTVDQLKFMADEGFPALEDNGLPRRDVKEQERIGKALENLGMEMGVFVAHADFGKPTFGLEPAKIRERIEADMRNAVEVAGRVNAKWCTVVPGAVQPRVPMEYQMANVIDNLKFAAEILEPAGLVAVLEPLNPWRDHPGLVLTGIPQAYLVCRGVGSPSVKILDDLYHQQITEGNLSGNLDRAWEEIAYVQVGDHPGRKEPGTGEIRYRWLFDRLKAKSYGGIVGMEHGNAGNGREGERAVIDAYVRADGGA